MRRASGSSTSPWSAAERVACTTVPCRSVRIAVQAVPARVVSSRERSAAAACSSTCPRVSAEWIRLGVTGSNAIRSTGLRWPCTQRDHDWITLSLTSPDGRTPSSK